MNQRTAALVCLASAVALSAAPLRAAPAPKAGGPPRVLAVSSDKTGNWEIYLVQAASGDAKRLTETKYDNTQPVWSPDGGKIAFVSKRDNCSNLWLMNADGTGARALTVKHTNCDHPRWSPDGKRIAFSSTKEGRPDVFVVELATGTVTNLTECRTACFEPEWSADGKKLSYTCRVDQVYTTRTMRADGTGHESLGNETATDAVWSPVGAQIAFTGRVSEPNGYQVFTANADGLNRKQLTTGGRPLSGLRPRWSPDGSKIAYSEWADNDIQIAVIAGGGGEPKVLTSGFRHLSPRWSPDGRSLGYVRCEKDRPAVLVVSNADGTGARDLLTHVHPDTAAEWKPK